MLIELKWQAHKFSSEYKIRLAETKFTVWFSLFLEWFCAMKQHSVCCINPSNLYSFILRGKKSWKNSKFQQNFISREVFFAIARVNNQWACHYTSQRLLTSLDGKINILWFPNCGQNYTFFFKPVPFRYFSISRIHGFSANSITFSYKIGLNLFDLWYTYLFSYSKNVLFGGVQ